MESTILCLSMYQTQITFLNNAETHLHTHKAAYIIIVYEFRNEGYVYRQQYERSPQQLMRLFRKQKYFVAHKK